MAYPITGSSIKNLEADYTRAQHAKAQNATYTPPNLKFSANLAATPAPVHSNLGDFLVNSSAMLHQHTATNAQTNANAKAYQGYVPSKNSESNNFTKNTDLAIQPKLEPLHVVQQQIQARTPIQANTQPVKAADTQVLMQSKPINNDHKGYGSKLSADPMLSVLANRSANDSNAVSFGYIGAVNRREHSTGEDKSSGKEWSAQREIKSKPEAKSAPSHVTTAQKVAEIENLQKVTQELTKQLQKSHPSISVPIQHPDGIVDINLRFSSNGSVRALFAGSNPEVVQLMAQHRDQFVRTIKGEGYDIDERQIGFIHQDLTKNSIRI